MRVVFYLQQSGAGPFAHTKKDVSITLENNKLFIDIA